MKNQRALAAIVLQQVLKQTPLDAALEAHLKEVRNPREQAFIKEICYGCCRWYYRLEAILNSLLKSPIKHKNLDLKCLLIVGLYQLIYLHVPQYAAVSDTVQAASAIGKSWAKSLVNKILRQFIRHETKLFKKINQKSLSLYAHPQWLIDEIVQAYPTHWQAILDANNERPPLTLRVNVTKLSRKDFLHALKKANIEAVADDACDSAVTLSTPKAVQQIPGFKQGWFSVQDAASQKVAGLLDIQQAHRVLDACSAPGGKATHILERMPQLKQLVAVDVSPDRMYKIQQNIARLDLPHDNIYMALADAAKTDQWWNGKGFDRILLDAPCSALGVIRRHPDIKLLRDAAGVNKQVQIQQRLLDKLWPLLNKRGKLLYTTCSILPQENTRIIEQFVKQHRDCKIEYEQQQLPGQQGMDGFFYALLSKL